MLARLLPADILRATASRSVVLFESCNGGRVGREAEPHRTNRAGFLFAPDVSYDAAMSARSRIRNWILQYRNYRAERERESIQIWSVIFAVILWPLFAAEWIVEKAIAAMKSWRSKPPPDAR
jgi:hypothetical protein